VNDLIAQRDKTLRENGIFGPLICGNCRECCSHFQRIELTEKEGERFVWYVRPGDHDKVSVAHKPNGECLYLGPCGCTRYADRPEICRIFDCRLMTIMNDPGPLTDIGWIKRKEGCHAKVWKKRVSPRV